MDRKHIDEMIDSYNKVLSENIEELNEGNEEKNKILVKDLFEKLAEKVDGIWSDKDWGLSDADSKQYDKNADAMLKEMLKHIATQVKIWDKYVNKQAELLGWNMTDSSVFDRKNAKDYSKK